MRNRLHWVHGGKLPQKIKEVIVKTKKSNIYSMFTVIFTLVFTACASTSAAAVTIPIPAAGSNVSPLNELSGAIRHVSNYLHKEGSMHNG